MHTTSCSCSPPSLPASLLHARLSHSALIPNLKAPKKPTLATNHKCKRDRGVEFSTGLKCKSQEQTGGGGSAPAYRPNSNAATSRRARFAARPSSPPLTASRMVTSDVASSFVGPAGSSPSLTRDLGDSGGVMGTETVLENPLIRMVTLGARAKAQGRQEALVALPQPARGLPLAQVIAIGRACQEPDCQLGGAPIRCPPPPT